jgi:hypothetical protein
MALTLSNRVLCSQDFAKPQAKLPSYLKAKSLREKIMHSDKVGPVSINTKKDKPMAVAKLPNLKP